MTLKSKAMDWAGNTLIVSAIQLAPKPGQLDKTSNLNILGTGNVQEDALAVTLTSSVASDATIVFDKVDGAVITLPAPVIGLRVRAVVDVVSSSVGQKIITDAGTTFIKGTLIYLTTSGPVIATDTANGSSHRSINFNGTTTGGIAGTWVELICRSATVWEIVGGINIKSGSVATTFATS